MSFARCLVSAAAGVAAMLLAADRAEARCVINSGGIAITPVSASTGTYTPPTAPTAQPTTFTITGTYDTNFTAGTCQVGISFNRSSLPASMARSGGGATLPYTIQSAAGGGATLLFTGGGNAPLANVLIHAFASAGPNLNNVPFTATLTAYFLAQPGSPQLAGSYSDGPTVRIYNIRPNGNRNQLASRAFTVTGTVAPSCTIGGVTNPAADAATIPVDSMGLVDTAPIVRSYSGVDCNSISNLQVTSLGGAVKRTAAAPGGFTNLIDYTALASFGGATSSLDTATIPAATGTEAGSTGTTSSSTPSGILSVTITPSSPAQPLVSGSYSDTLRVTITAQ